MCQYCWEELGVRVLAAELRGEPRLLDVDAPWCQPVLLQEGIHGIPNSVPAPVTRRCLAIKAAWREGRVPAPLPLLSDGHVLEAWGAPRGRGAATPADRTAAQALLWRYREWSTEAARRHIWRGTPSDAETVLEAFPALWAAWVMMEDDPCAPGVLPLARGLATGAPVLTDETVELWLQRRAVLLWCEVEGVGAVFDRYGTELRPFLAHYAALRRPPSSAERARLVRLADQHGERAALEWLPA